jgi:ABC-2 type transport system ATP-binding protein
MREAALVRVENLYRYYGDHGAVMDVSFTLSKGEVLGFLGPNGAGKSTTMQVISGNLAPSAGRIEVDGVDMLDDPKRAKAAVGYLPEQPPLYRDLTVDEYLDYCARLRALRGSEARRARDYAKERCGLSGEGQRLIGNLSKGFQQRVGIAQAIIHTPPVVILDEPTVGLDPIQIREIRALIHELGREHSVILSTHILPEVQAICNRVQIIRRGELVFSDSIEALTRRMEHSALTVALRNPPPVDTLGAFQGVTAVTPVDSLRFRLEFAPEHNPAERLVWDSVKQGWGLFELIPEQMTMEDVFVELTREEPSTDLKEARA